MHEYSTVINPIRKGSYAILKVRRLDLGEQRRNLQCIYASDQDIEILMVGRYVEEA